MTLTTDEKSFNGVIYRLQFNTCGKENCKKCSEGDGHGPYWYAYGIEFARKYIGKELPTDIVENMERLEKDRETLRSRRDEIKTQALELKRQYETALEQIRTLDSLMSGLYASPRILADLGLELFSSNGRRKEINK